MTEVLGSFDESAPEFRSAVAALGRALDECQHQLEAVLDPEGRRKLRLSTECWEVLQGSVAKFTALAKAGGAYPERVLIRIKEISKDHAPALDRQSPLREAIIRESIRAYFTS
jgi:hypothetical protein